ncbi:glutaredoxin family protein [Antrihabitans cavernicola]|uniref:Glutaredoxin family protein n=1 Tax=Antrihabitans cavernicola TaxID=2495913 RepID=A0A5A7SB19_9NOCA|nr:glutaredoxin family protein [Spelaeibacter cavernicola]KAA0022352.1 glutaredoxin family protein [Spelaeibacter cavernicola]
MITPTNAVTLLTRAGCGLCDVAHGQLVSICAEFGATLDSVDVDAAAATEPGLRAEYGDRLPVVLLNGREHSYWEVDEARLRADLAR